MALAIALSDILMFGLAWANAQSQPATIEDPEQQPEERPPVGPCIRHAGSSLKQHISHRGVIATSLRAILAPITALLGGLDAAQVSDTSL